MGIHCCCYTVNGGALDRVRNPIRPFYLAVRKMMITISSIIQIGFHFDFFLVLFDEKMQLVHNMTASRVFEAFYSLRALWSSFGNPVELEIRPG